MQRWQVWNGEYWKTQPPESTVCMRAQFWHERRYSAQLNAKSGWASFRFTPKANLRSRSRLGCVKPTRILDVGEDEIGWTFQLRGAAENSPFKSLIVLPRLQIDVGHFVIRGLVELAPAVSQHSGSRSDLPSAAINEQFDTRDETRVVRS
jgi:hypothetical protein